MYSTCEEASKRTAKIIIAFLTMVKLRNVWCIAVIKSLLRVLCLHPAIVGALTVIISQHCLKNYSLIINGQINTAKLKFSFRPILFIKNVFANHSNKIINFAVVLTCI